jgi:SAM-dependent methyltransferase
LLQTGNQAVSQCRDRLLPAWNLLGSAGQGINLAQAQRRMPVSMHPPHHAGSQQAKLMTSPESADLFARSWSLYDLITEHNYMFHREIYTEVAGLLKQRADHGNYRLLDLGCGNARYLAPALIQSPPGHYQGVDLSEDALEEARAYLDGLADVQLRHGDLLSAIESTTESWDVIFTGYALHHLSREEKLRLFHAAGRCLSDGGWLLMVDVVREEGQSREDYLDDYLKFMRESWTKVPEDQLDEACAHVEAHDYPESLSTLSDMACSSGLTKSHVASRYGQHYTAMFSRG